MPPAQWPLLVPDAPAAVWQIGAALLGAVVGSFANVCIHRLPRDQSIVHPRSCCPGCGALVEARDNVPVLSYLLLGGRCRRCRMRISPRYPAVEIANGLLYWLVASASPPDARALCTMVFLTSLLILALVDLDFHILPDVVTLPGIPFGLAASFLPGAPAPPLECLASAAGGYLAFMLVALAYRRFRGIEGLGQGDWKMAAMLGAFFGWQRLLLTITLATFAGSVVGVSLIVFKGRDARYALPLGTFLGCAGIAVALWGGPVLVWYRRLLLLGG